MNITDYYIYNNHCAIEKLQKKQNACKSLACMCIFIYLCMTIVPTVMQKRSDAFLSSIIIWIVAILFMACAFIFDSKYVLKIKNYEIKNYEIEKEALERKIRVAKIKNEILADNIADKKLSEPIKEITYPFSFYMVVIFVHVLIGIWTISATRF